MTCPYCSAPLVERHCKVLCLRCGRFADCGDTEPAARDNEPEEGK